MGRYYELYGINRYSVASSVKAVMVAFAGVVFVYIFPARFRLSPDGDPSLLLLEQSLAPQLLGLLRFYRKNYSKNRFNSSGTIKTVACSAHWNRSENHRPALADPAQEVEWNYEIVGLIAQKNETWV